MNKNRFSFERLFLLLKKECLQIMKDRSVFGTVFGIPLILLFVFGYGIRMDFDRIPFAFVVGEHTPVVESLVRDFTAGRQFNVIGVMSRPEAEALFKAKKVEVILQIPQGFSNDFVRGEAEAAITIQGVDAQTALTLKNRADMILSKWATKSLPNVAGQTRRHPTVTLEFRSWFNDENDSTRYMVPGLMGLIIAMCGSFMCSLVVAREWERNTMPSLLVTPATTLELFLSKWIPYGVLTAASFFFALIVAAFLFDTRLYGSFAMMSATAMLYGIWSTSFGLFLSAKLKSQFLANQLAIIASFLPTVILSGLIFDLRCTPAFIDVISHFLPPYYAIESLKICFLSGGSEPILWRNLLILIVWCIPTVAGALAAMQKPGRKGHKPKNDVLQRRSRA